MLFLCSQCISAQAGAFAAYKNKTLYKLHTEISDGPSLLQFFREACEDPLLVETIDKKYRALHEQKTWTDVAASPFLHPVP